MQPSPRRYKVNGREFTSSRLATAYAKKAATETGRAVPMMEKLDQMTPWHVVTYYR